MADEMTDGGPDDEVVPFDRRRFLRRLAIGAAFTAPIVRPFVSGLASAAPKAPGGKGKVPSPSGTTLPGSTPTTSGAKAPSPSATTIPGTSPTTIASVAPPPAG